MALDQSGKRSSHVVDEEEEATLGVLLQDKGFEGREGVGGGAVAAGVREEG